jgi:hypothetical protein
MREAVHDRTALADLLTMFAAFFNPICHPIKQSPTVAVESLIQVPSNELARRPSGMWYSEARCMDERVPSQ